MMRDPMYLASDVWERLVKPSIKDRDVPGPTGPKPGY
jgi:hypothetical protein